MTASSMTGSRAGSATGALVGHLGTRADRGLRGVGSRICRDCVGRDLGQQDDPQVLRLFLGQRIQFDPRVVHAGADLHLG